MRILTKFSILLMSASLCAALVGCQQRTDQPKPKTDTGKNGSTGSMGAKVDSAVEKTKEKAKEVGSATKEKTQEIASTVKEKAQDVGTATKEKVQR